MGGECFFVVRKLGLDDFGDIERFIVAIFVAQLAELVEQETNAVKQTKKRIALHNDAGKTTPGKMDDAGIGDVAEELGLIRHD